MTTDFVNDVERLRSFRQTFLLFPDYWRSFQNTVRLNWDWVKFEPGSEVDVPSERGVYAFVLEPDLPNTFQHGYPLYIGETGNRPTKTPRNLKVRFGEYIQNKRNIRRRHGIHFMLNLWPDDLYFYFAEVSDVNENLKTLEAKLNDTLTPPFSERDFSAEIGPKVRVARR